MAKRKPKSEPQSDERNGKEPNPEYENFQQALKQVLSVSKEELDQRRAEEKREREETRAG